MDDLHKNILHIWELRLKLEHSRKKLKRLEAISESEEYKSRHTEEEYLKTRKEIQEIKKEQFLLEETQIQLEEKIQLPNPYLEEN